MYFLPHTADSETSPLTFESLHAFYVERDCTTFTKASLIRTLRTMRFSNADSPESKQEDDDFSLTMETLCTFTQALIDAFPQHSDNSYPLEELVGNIDNDNDTVNKMAIQLWVQRFRLFFPEEEAHLAILTTFSQLCDTPIQMCAALCVLIEQFTDEDEILRSGLLQGYARRNMTKMARIVKTYQLFKDHAFEHKHEIDTQENLEDALATIPLLDDKGRMYAGIGPYTIHGQFIPDVQSNDVVEVVRPPFDWNLDESRLRHLLEHIGLDVIIEVLKRPLPLLYYLNGQSNLSRVLPELSIDDLARLYIHISTQVSTDDNLRSRCLVQLNRMLSREKILAVLRTSTVSPWVLLSSKPALIQDLTPEDWDRIRSPLKDTASDQPHLSFVAARDIQAAYSVAVNQDCDPTLRDDILIAIANVWLYAPYELDINEPIVNSLLDANIVQAWVTEQAADYAKQWVEALKGVLSPLTPDTYLSIVDIGQTVRQQARRLQKISGEAINLPLDVHQQAGQVLAAALVVFDEETQAATETKHEEPDTRSAHVESILSIMAPVDKYYHEPTTVDTVDLNGPEEKEETPTTPAAQLAAARTEARQQAKKDVDLAKARILFETVCYTQDNTCFKLLLTPPYYDHIPSVATRDNVIKAQVFLPNSQLAVLSRRCNMGLMQALDTPKPLGRTLQTLTESQSIRLLDKLNSYGLTHIIKSSSDLLAVIKHLNDVKRDKILERLPHDLSFLCSDARSLYRIIGILSDSQQKNLLNRLRNLSDIITTGTKLGHILRQLSETQRMTLLERLEGLRVNCIESGRGLGATLKYLNTTQRNFVIDRLLPSELSSIINDGLELAAALEHLDLTQRATLLSKLPEQLNQILHNGYDLALVLPYIPPIQRTNIFAKLGISGSNIITDGYQLAAVLKNATPEECDDLLHMLTPERNSLSSDSDSLSSDIDVPTPDLDSEPHDLTDIIQDGDQLGRVLECLNGIHKDYVLGCLPDELHTVIRSGRGLGCALRHLNDEQSAALIARLPEGLSITIPNATELGLALAEVNESQRKRLLETTQSRLSTLVCTATELNCILKQLSNIEHSKELLAHLPGAVARLIKTSTHLTQALKDLNDLQSTLLLERLSENLLSVIRSGYQLGAVFRDLRHEQRDIFLRYLPEEGLSEIIKNGSQLRDSLRYLSKKQCITLLAKLPDGLTDSIKDGYQFGTSLQFLNRAQRDVLLKKLPEDLGDLIISESQLSAALKLLSIAQRSLLLNRLPRDLGNIELDAAKLANILRHLNGRQAAQVLEGLEARLPTILPKGYPSDNHHAALVTQKLVAVQERYQGLLFDGTMPADPGAGGSENSSDQKAALGLS